MLAEVRDCNDSMRKVVCHLVLIIILLHNNLIHNIAIKIDYILNENYKFKKVTDLNMPRYNEMR